jgi:hypothetical protein
MMRPPPGGTLPHNVHRSWPQNDIICIAWRGINGGIGPSGTAAAGAGAAAAGGAPAGGGDSASAAGGGPLSPPPASALWHACDSAAALTCRQRNATGLPGLTPVQCSTNSDRHAGGTAVLAGGRACRLPSARVRAEIRQEGSGRLARARQAPVEVSQRRAARACWLPEGQPVPAVRLQGPGSAQRRQAPPCTAPTRWRHCA